MNRAADVFGVFMSGREDRTVELGCALAEVLGPGDVVAIAGELGAGKTRLVRGLALGLGHDVSEVSSPTYVLAHEHDTPGARCPLIHIDAYRLPGGLNTESLEADLGLDERTLSEALIAIEWPGRLGIQDGLLGGQRVGVQIDHMGGTRRRVTITRLS